MKARLENRVALIIGGSGGIGRAIVSRFVTEGAKVISTSTSAPPGDVKPETSESGVLSIRCDLREPESVEAVAAYCNRTFGRLDILVNNAGISIGSQRIHETNLDDWQRLMDVNLRGVFIAMRVFLPMMIAAKTGCIINMGSTSAFRGTPGVAAYCASKAAVIQLTRVAALEYVKDGIRVNAVCPGTVQTPLVAALSPERLNPLLARIPMGRFAQPDEVAALTAFLASDDAAYITGQGYLLDGGRLSG